MIFRNDDPRKNQYPFMAEYTDFLKKMERPLIGREKEMQQLMAAMARPELSNVILLAEAGTGKTALVQGTMLNDPDRAYLEVNLPKMISNLKNENEMADRLKSLFREVERFRNEEGKEIVLFIDEFHQIIQLSSAAVEVLKPLLADSGTRGIRVIAATTYIEYQQYVASNLPLVERLQRINIPQPSRDVVVSILKGMAKRYGVANQFMGHGMFEAIYEYTNRYIPANAQPRKSILMLDSMIGWHRVKKCPIDMKLLSDVIYETEGINIAFRVDATKIKSQLDKVVIAQEFASSQIESRLQICCADLNNKNKPMSSFLFTGSTGVGKGLRNDTRIPIFTEDGSIRFKNNGDLKIGDYVFNRKGEPVKVTGVYPRGMQDIYKVTFTDGRYIYTDSSHLWTYMLNKGKQTENTYTNSTKELLDRGVYITNKKTGKRKLRYWIPMNEAVKYPEANLSVHPYVMGAFIGDGSLTVKQLTLSSGDEELVAHVAKLLGNCTYKHANLRNFNWIFPLDNSEGQIKSKQMADVFANYPEVCGKRAEQKRIPDAYKYASIQQRWELIKGLFDTDGSIGDTNRYSVSYSTTSYGLAQDIVDVLYSLGVASTIQVARYIEDHSMNGNYTQYRVNVKSSHKNKDRFFSLSRKLAIAEKAKVHKENKSHKKNYHWVGISEIELMLAQAETTCIMVDDEEHLYQAGQYIVTHNTEMSKQLANILFEDERALVRMDMTEYALPESLERFRLELTQAVWTRPYCIILLDEIEKACAPVTRILLQVLDDGRLLDRNNREVTFKNAYIIVTTNAGSEIYKNIAQYNVDDKGSGKMLEKYESLIRESIKGTTGGGKFPPELLGRIDCLVPFQPLSELTMASICHMKLTKLREDIMKKHHITVIYEKRVVSYIVQDKLTTDSDAGGARGVVSRIEREVTTELSRYINSHPEIRTGGRTVYVCVDGELVVENKNRLSTDAHIVILDHPRTRESNEG